MIHRIWVIVIGSIALSALAVAQDAAKPKVSKEPLTAQEIAV